jgi:bifunctional non-homologous end joining protein LigD
MPAIIAPQLATLVKAPPAGTRWVHDMKFDGYRMLCRSTIGRRTFISRNGKEWTDASGRSLMRPG